MEEKVASILGVGRSVGLGIGPSRAESVAVRGPSDTGEGAVPPKPSKPGSGRKPTRVGSGPDSACALKGAQGGKGVRRARAERRRGERSLSLPGGARVGPGADSRGVRLNAGPLLRSEARPGGGGVARRGPSDAGEGAAPPRRAEHGSGWEPTRLGSGQVSAPSRARRRGQAAKALPSKSEAT